MFHKIIFLLFMSVFSFGVLGNLDKPKSKDDSKVGDLLSAKEHAERVQAFERSKQLAEQGDITAIIYLGWAYLEGKGVERDYDKARKYFEKAGDNNPRALYYLGELEERVGSESSAISYYERALEEGKEDPDFKNSKQYFATKYSLGRILAQNTDSKDLKRAYQLLEEVANEEHVNNEHRYKVMTLIGRMYLEGEGVERDHGKAREYFEKAGDNNPRALYYLGELEERVGSESSAISYYERALEEGKEDPDFENSEQYFRAKHSLGMILFKSNDSKNLKEAYSHLRQVAGRKDKRDKYFYEANTVLALLNLQTEEYLLAKIYLEKIEQDFPLARYILGHIYHKGLGVSVDLQKAGELFSSTIPDIKEDKYDYGYTADDLLPMDIEAKYVMGRVNIESSDKTLISKGIADLKEVVSLIEKEKDANLSNEEKYFDIEEIKSYGYKSANFLGLLYREKLQDYKKAAHWFKKASEIAEGEDKFYPHFNLAVMHGRGETGVLPNGRWNFPVAYHLMNMALHSGGGDKKTRREARRVLSRSFKQFTSPEQRAESDKLCLSIFKGSSARGLSSSAQSTK